MALSREAFIAKAKPKTAEKEIPGLGKVLIRQFTSREQTAFVEMLKNEVYTERAGAKWWLLAQCILDGTSGERMFANSELDLLADSAGETISEIIEQLTRFSEADLGAIARAGEPLAETSTSEPASGSPSLSASLSNDSPTS